MPIHYTAPLQRAWARAKGILFRPFNLETWIILGFTAWLARLWDNAGLGGSNWTRGEFQLDGDDLRRHHFDRDWDHESFLEWFGLGALELWVVMMLVVGGLLLALLLAWLSSRGEFMFLDNIVTRRARVSEPWRRYGGLGDTLFIWRIAFQIVAGAVAIALILPSLFMILPIAEGGAWRGLGLLGVIGLGMTGFVLGLLATLVNFWTDSFVVPLMYKHDLTILDGWRRFLPLLRTHTGPLVLYALFYLLLSIGVGLAVAAVCLITCCVGGIILAIPYIGTVLLLPIYTTARALGPEFLAQFGDEYRLWNGDEDSQEITPEKE
ncbi:MAG: hypothetical protein ABIF77_04360 [bacterium]